MSVRRMTEHAPGDGDLRVDSEAVLLLLIQHSLVSFPNARSRTITPLETEVADESVGDPTYIGEGRLLGPVSAPGSTECSLAGGPDGRRQENEFPFQIVRSRVGCFRCASYGPNCGRPSP